MRFEGTYRATLFRNGMRQSGFFCRRGSRATVTADEARRLADIVFAARLGPDQSLSAVTARVMACIAAMDSGSSLKALVERYVWLPTLLAAMLRHKLQNPAPVLTALSKLTTAI